MAVRGRAGQGAIEMVQPHLDNSLDSSASARPIVAGIIGDRPSLYAKSPLLWNAVFRDLGLDAAYLPFDVSAENLPRLVEALRGCATYVGGNVTVPYKVQVMDLLDEVDPLARQIGAVNTISRTRDGRLVGYNTDATGAVESLVRRMSWQECPFLKGLAGKRVLLVGAGGAGRAVAFAIAQQVGKTGAMWITNRSAERARELAEEVRRAYGVAQALSEDELSDKLADVDLVINASTRGQAGVRRLPGGLATCLEPYSPLAPANPATFQADEQATEADFYRAWYEASVEDIHANTKASANAILGSGRETAYFDLIYAPQETTLLRQARLSGRPTLNGKGMNIIQAVEAFVHRVMKPHLGEAADGAYERVSDAMAGVW